jgi:hypothetical protein
VKRFGRKRWQFRRGSEDRKQGKNDRYGSRPAAKHDSHAICFVSFSAFVQSRGRQAKFESQFCEIVIELE